MAQIANHFPWDNNSKRFLFGFPVVARMFVSDVRCYWRTKGYVFILEKRIPTNTALELFVSDITAVN
jgi:hypothetical protein